MPTSIKRILFVGYGRAGKDEAAFYISSKTPLRYAGSFSWAALPHMANFLGLHPQVAWDTRSKHRETWKNELDRLRKTDQCFLARKVLATGEVTAGLRDKAEIDAVKAEKLFDHIIWIHRPGIPVDPTVTFGPQDCDFCLYNNGTLDDFHKLLDRLIHELDLPLK